MDPEQYMIADEICILDTGKAKRELGWKPMHRDEDMLLAAYTNTARASRTPINRSRPEEPRSMSMPAFKNEDAAIERTRASETLQRRGAKNLDATR
jgi:hypothetical protein